jgi:hypothetical protein
MYAISGKVGIGKYEVNFVIVVSSLMAVRVGYAVPRRQTYHNRDSTQSCRFIVNLFGI